jgi:hypothetical protein
MKVIYLELELEPEQELELEPEQELEPEPELLAIPKLHHD